VLSSEHAKTWSFTPSAASQTASPEVAGINSMVKISARSKLDSHEHTAFDTEDQVVLSPELDEMLDTDDVKTLRLVVPREFSANSGTRTPADRPMFSNTEDTDILPRTPQHRRQPTGPAKSRVLIAAMAAGAAAAAAHSVFNQPEKSSSVTVLASERTPISEVVNTPARGMQLITVKPAASSSVHNEELAKGVAFAAERAEREARLSRPLFVKPTKGIFTSGFGYRWGALHGGVDLAAPIGTPIYAASDGVVIDVGPTAGYGAWVKLRHSDGTVTLYGHINTWNVQIGQRVMAGDQIATVGNRGNSTGPHLHFEVLLNGVNRTDPVPWLAKRGLSVGPYAG
jgi:murein DD-endopeptidase MepM/ murein hydrolase activator NlpD